MGSAAKPNWRVLFLDIGCLVIALVLAYLYVRTGSDVLRYRVYALAFWTHQPLFHEFPLEYPPLVLIPFSLTLYSGRLIDYWGVFAGCMGVLVCVLYLWFARTVSRRRAIIYALYLLVGATGTVLDRYDLVPAVVTLAALVLAERRRSVWASVLLAIGALLKIYPLFLMPVVLAYLWHTSRREALSQPGVWQDEERFPVQARFAGSGKLCIQRPKGVWQKERWLPILKSLGTFVGIVMLGFGVPAVLNFQGMLSVFQYAFQRPLEVESFPATLLWLGSQVGFPASRDFSFGSSNLVGPLDQYLKALSLVGLVVGSGVVYWRVAWGKLTLGQGFVATLAVVLTSNKVLSTQYIVWILPLVAYAEGFDWLWLVIAVLTTLIYPFLYYSPSPLKETFLPTIALRNFLLLIATVWAIRGRASAKAAESQGIRPREEQLVLTKDRPQHPTRTD